MKSKERNLFAGGNTPEGFYSYYQYILGQKEAEAIFCIKGGPGVGKSSFMKEVGKYFLDRGEDVDYFWCSSDPESLDGVLLRNRKVAFVDGTSPHIVDPINPGAVDTIIHLGEYWEGEALKRYKSYIMQSNKKIKSWFEYAYNDLKAAAALRSTLTSIYNNSMSEGEKFRTTADIIHKEMSYKPVSISVGQCKKYFATAITPRGMINHMPSLINGCKKIYFFTAPVAADTCDMLRIISENALHRGYSVEQYYCPMDPEKGIEHLLIPELEAGFITINNYHDLDSWEVAAETEIIELREFMDWNSIEAYKENIDICEKNIEYLINKAITNLKKAKQEHDILEEYYIPNMNFEKIEKLRDEWIAKVEQNKV